MLISNERLGAGALGLGVKRKGFDEVVICSEVRFLDNGEGRFELYQVATVMMLSNSRTVERCHLK